MAMKHGYDSVEEYKEGVQKKFSLLETGIIQKPSTRLLLINVRAVPTSEGREEVLTATGHTRRAHAHRRLDDVV